MKSSDLSNPKKDIIGVTQKSMCMLADVVNTTIYRAITDLGIDPIEGSSKKNCRYSIENTRKVLKGYFFDRFVSKLKVQCFYNFKGGVGKTSLCFQISSHLALCGYNVLVIDADPQGHLSTSLGIDTEKSYYTLFDAIIGNVELEKCIKNIYEGFDCIPSNLAMTRAEIALTEMENRGIERISKLIQPFINKYDFIIFDTNPTIGCLNRGILMCCDMINIVVETQAYSLNGVKLLLGDIFNLFNLQEKNIPEILMIPNKYEDRTVVSGEAMSILSGSYYNYLKPDFAIRRSEDFNIASKISKPLAFFCRYNSLAFEDIVEILRYFVQKACRRK